MARFCLALDLEDDAALMAAYVEHHRRVWPEVLESIRAGGVTGMEIYKVEDRLFMIMETDGSFSFERMRAMDAANPAVLRWEALMAGFQKALPGTAAGEKWRRMELIFDLGGPA